MKREAFRRMIEADLRAMGYKAGSWIWQANPSRLMLALDGSFREIPIRANMRKEDLAFWRGKLSGWAEMLGLTPAAEPAPTKRKPRQIDLEDAIAAAGA